MESGWRRRSGTRREVMMILLLGVFLVYFLEKSDMSVVRRLPR